MSKLIFIYGTMNSCKSAQALMKKFEYEQKGYSVLLLKPSLDTRDDKNGQTFVTSRIGLQSPCITFAKEQDIVSFCSTLPEKCDVIMVDEAQFCTGKQVDQLRMLASSKIVICYGLKVNFRGQMFEGSKRLIELADETSEFSTLCACGKKATMNGRKVNGKVIVEGEEIVVGGDEKYEAMCYDCWKNGQK